MFWPMKLDPSALSLLVLLWRKYIPKLHWIKINYQTCHIHYQASGIELFNSYYVL
jgi:hypothetical protein